MDECCVQPNTITLFEQFSVKRPKIDDIHHHICSFEEGFKMVIIFTITSF